MDIKRLLGQRIQELRKSKNYTQEYMSELIGIEKNSLSNIERGVYFPTAENLNKILDVLNISPSEIFTIEHLAPCKDLINEMCSAFNGDEKLTRLVYKFFKLIK